MRHMVCMEINKMGGATEWVEKEGGYTKITVGAESRYTQKA